MTTPDSDDQAPARGCGAVTTPDSDDQAPARGCGANALRRSERSVSARGHSGRPSPAQDWRVVHRRSTRVTGRLRSRLGLVDLDSARSMRSVLPAVIGVLLALASSMPAVAAVRFVDENATVSVNDGSTWCDAFLTLQDALAVAAATDEIRVADGTYYPDEGGSETNGDRDATFQLINGVTINGGYAGCGAGDPDARDTSAFETILSGDLDQDDLPGDFPDGATLTENSRHVVTGSGTNATAVIDGFTMTAGNHEGGGGSGGGMLNVAGSPTVRNCLFSGNTSGGGAGMSNVNSSPTVVNCTFRGNEVVTTGSAAVLNNGSGSPFYVNCLFAENVAGAFGGVTDNLATVTPVFMNCVFDNNSAGADGGAVVLSGSTTVTLINSTFSRNDADGVGGGVRNDNATVVLDNCILWGNTDNDGANSDQSAQISTLGGTTTVNNCIVEGWTGSLGGTGNIGGDPLFVDAAAGDLRITSGSPAIDAGDNSAVPADSGDLDDDLDTGEVTPLDLDGNDRFIDDPGSADTGSGTPPIVDMGAYELGPPVFVDASAGGLADGTSWADAYTTLQDALADPRITGGSASEIWVAAGTYYPDEGGTAVADDRSETFQLLDGVAVYGGFAGTETALGDRDVDANVTILSGDITQNDTPVTCTVDSPDCDSNGGVCVDGFCIIDDNNAENSYHVVTGSGTVATAVLDGFTVSAANAEGIGLDNFGGGMHCASGSPTVANCTFRGNRAAGGGGGMHNEDSSPIVTNCTFSGNSANGVGGGMHNDGSSPTVGNCTFSGNSADDGGGMFNTGSSSPTVTNCTFSGNSGGGTNGGGGMFNEGNSSPTVTNCTFSGNSAGNSGGGMFNLASSPTVRNCTFSGNSADINGGGMYNNSLSNPTATNCIFWNNIDDADASAGGPFSDESAQIHTASGTPTVNYSIVQGVWTGAGGTGNGSSDPLFVDADGADDVAGTDDDDLRIRIGSPAIDGGDNSAVPADSADLDGDLDTGEPTPFDLDGNDRFVDDPDVADSGAGTPPIVDMGAFELAPPVFVEASAGGFADGTSWQHAYTTLQDALADARITGGTADEIWVAAETYYPDEGGTAVADDRNETFQLINGVAIYGGFAGTETTLDDRDVVANETTLSGDITQNDSPVACTMDGDCGLNGGLCLQSGFCIVPDNNAENSHHVITGSGSDATAVLDGFTITAGNTNTNGGGMLNDTGSPTVSNCIIRGNKAFTGGGMYNITSSPTIADCRFEANTADTGGGGDGGGLFSNGGIQIVSGCTFVENVASFGAGAYNISNPGTTLTNCKFLGNSATQVGGGTYNAFEDVVFTNCLFTGNTAPSGGGAGNNDTNSTFADCTFSLNEANSSGGGMMFTNPGSPSITNCILWGNIDSGGTDESAQIDTDSGPPVVNYSLIQGLTGGLGGTGNIDANPLFVDADGTDNIPGTEDDNLRIKPGSPARDAGNSTAVPADSADLDGDLNTTERTPLDLDGNPRFVDDVATVDTGVAASPVVDMGAYEGLSAVVFVDADATGADDGTSWADAYPNLQDALADPGIAGGSVSAIWVAEGTYKPDIGVSQTLGVRTETFQLIDGLALYGGFAGTETSLSQRNVSANETVLSGDLSGDDSFAACTADSPDCDSNGGLCVDGFCIIDNNNAENSYHVVTGSGTDASATLDGFTITAGNGDGAAAPDDRGGGVYAFGGSPRLANCTVTGNWATFQGGMHIEVGSPQVTSCTFLRNGADYAGGAAVTGGSSATLTDCVFRENSGLLETGALGIVSSSPTLLRCDFDRNRVPGGVAGLAGAVLIENGAPLMVNCTFTGNQVSGASGHGGALYGFSSASPTLVNCFFSGNTASGSGGAVYRQVTSDVTMVNSTLSGNTAGNLGGALFGQGAGGPTLHNCVLWGNRDSGGSGESAQINDNSVTLAVTYSLVEGLSGLAGSGNIDGDPLFVDADGPDNVLGTEDDNLRISACSPAIDAGDNDEVPADTLDLDEDLNTTEPLPYDYLGRPRFIDDPNSTDCAQAPGTCGTAPIVDMGAFEFAPPLFVDADAAGGAEDGSSWADAFTNLQDALGHADVLSGEVTEVWVAAGTYMPDGGYKPVGGAHVPGSGLDTALGFQLRSGLGLYGGFDGNELCRDPRDREANETVLSGDLLDNDSPVACTDDSDCASNGGRCYQGFGAALDGFCIIKDNNIENNNHVVVVNGVDSAGILDGFTITGGNADFGISVGGGILGGGGGFVTDPLISRCVITGNSADSRGGGMFHAGGVDDTLRVRNCIFRGNAVIDSNALGGGLSYDSGSGDVTGCSFLANTAVGGPLASGGGLSVGAGETIVANCVFLGNAAVISGGGLTVSNSSASFENSIFSGNTANAGAGAIIVGGSASPTFTQCTFSGNDAVDDGGGLFQNALESTLANCIFWNNRDSGGIDESAQILDFSGTVTVDYSIVQGGWTGLGGTGILTSDPTFVLDPDDGGDGWGVGGNDDFGDLHLQSLSPAVDAGDNDAVPADGTDLDGDGDITEVLPVDLDDGPRILEDLLVADVGNAGALGVPIIDLGAYEFLRDCDGNGIADDQDMTNCAGDPGCADCNGNDIPDGCDIAGCDFQGLCTALVCVGGYNDGIACATDDDCQISCNDCDLNGVPDGCDDPVDNIPDDCVQAASSGNWSDDIWGLGGNFPDNVAGEPDRNVTLDGDVGAFAAHADSPPRGILQGSARGALDIVLDVDAEIPTLRIINGATLDGSGSSLTVVGNTAPLARDVGDPTETIIGPGSSYTASELHATDILVFGDDPERGLLLAISDCGPPAVCVITADSLSVAGGGRYRQVGAGSDMPLTAGSVTLSGGSCGTGAGGSEPNNIVGGGEIDLYDGMTITTVKDVAADKTGDFTINGSATADCSGALRGILPPPKLGTGCSSARASRSIPGIIVGGDFVVTGFARISISASSCGLNRALLPEQVVQLQGDFINRSQSPDFFDWESGGITLNGTESQQFEVGGLDIGATALGFNAPGVAGSNFSMGTVEIAPGADVTFVDNEDNDGRPQGLEALYVRDLVLGAGATVTIDNCKVYYGTLDDQGANEPIILRGGALARQSALVSAPLTAAFPHDRSKNRYVSFDPNKAEHDGKRVAFTVELAGIAQGSCDDGTGAQGGNVDFCRIDRGGDDCNACSGSGDSCISASIDCPPGESCDPTGAVCTNDMPNAGGSNIGQVWWVGPEKTTAPTNANVHLLVSKSFRKISEDWGDPVHVGDCEIVPQAVYSVRAVGATADGTGENVSDELLVQTIQFPPVSPPAPFWWGDAVGVLAFHCNGDIRQATCTDSVDCGGDPCERAWELPNGVTNIDDVTAALWTQSPQPPITVSADSTWVDVHGNDSFTSGSQNFDPPNNVINASDLQQIISGFGGFPYKFHDPADCPDAADWP